jgi:outer membrane protein
MTKISKPIVAVLAASLLFLLLGAAPAQAQKVGIVDIDKVFNEYYKTKIAEERINLARDAARKEVDARWAARVPLLEAIAGFNSDLDNKSLPAPVRADKTKRRDDKVVEVQNLEREVEQLNFARENAIRDEASRSRALIVEDIMKLVNERVKADGFDLVIDKSGASSGGLPVLLASKPDMDFTGDIIVALNKAKPAAAAVPPKAAPAKPAAAPKK